MEKKIEPSNEEYRMFREDLETLSESVGLLRNHFYNHAFNDGTILRIVEVRKIVEELYRLASNGVVE